MNSQIVQQENMTAIEGGTKAGTNLLHNFNEFPCDGTVYFNNSLDIQNIIVIVTGESVSNIDGLIRANGTANLFLVNPNGISFGKNASLDVGGSFFATTANSIKFADGFELSTADSSISPLLTKSVPIGFGFTSNIGEIQIEGNSSLKDISVVGSNQVFSSLTRGIKPSGLLVKSGKTLGLIGRNLTLDGATLTAEDGQIELGSVDSGSFVKLIPINEGWNLDYEEASSKDIHLSQGTLVDASGVSGGSIQVRGARVKLTDGSVLAIENLGTKENESLKINATESLEVSGCTPSGKVLSSVRTRGINPKSENKEELAVRKLADILISTKRLSLKEGGDIGSITGNSAQSGNVIVNASQSVRVVGFSPLNGRERSNIFATTLSTGSAGSLTIDTGVLTAMDNGFIATSSIGSGTGGSMTINAAKSIELDGPKSFLRARSLNTGNAGTITIRTTKLTAKNGGSIGTSTSASGEAGIIFVDADSVELSGSDKATDGVTIFSSINSSANIPSKAIQESRGVPAITTGKSGDVVINTKKLNIINGAEVSVKNEGKGNAGTIQINADTITALENSSITANAFEGKGGNIEINGTKLFVSPNAQITASSEKGVDGAVKINVPDMTNQTST